MNSYYNPSVDPQRTELRRKLGIESRLERRRCVRVGSLPLHTELYPCDDEKAPLLLFIPGIGTYSELYAELLSNLSAQGFNVVGVDLRGHGYSGGKRGLYTVSQVCSDLSQIIDHYRQSFTGSIYLYGYSIGALLGLACCERDQRIEKLVCGTLLIPEIPPDMLHQVGWSWIWSSALLLPGMKLPMKNFIDYDRLLAGHPAGDEINADPLIVFDYPLSTLSSLFTHKFGSLSRTYDFRGLIIHGSEDEVLPLSYSERVRDKLRQPFELVAVDGEGHMLPWNNPTHLAHVISGWLKR
jgi:pimeloyl-ACP methyl ester carboxylesterase